MGDDEVPEEGRILFISETAYAGLKDKITRYVQNGERGIETAIDYYDGMREFGKVKKQNGRSRRGSAE